MWLRRLHDEVHVTTIFVTHDQEEAMDVAEQIVVMNDGQIEQTGAPRDLYDHPKTEFVMGFVGPVNRRGALFIRPHDLEILQVPAPEAEEAMIERIVHLGFEARVELLLADGEQLWAQMTLRRGRVDGAGRRPDRLRAAPAGQGVRAERRVEDRGAGGGLSGAIVDIEPG